MAGVFLQKNITGAYQVIKKPPKSVVKVIRITAPAKDAVYNYSIQTLNSAEHSSETFLKARWGRGLAGCVISLCMILSLLDSDQSLGANRSGGYFLLK